MLYLERTITVNRGIASIDETVILYKGDKNVEIKFYVKNNPFRSKKTNSGPTFGQLIIYREKAEPIFSEVSQLSSGKILFVITKEMIDELNELGPYTFQVRLFNDDKTSRGTLPAIENGIEIKMPICEEEQPAEADIAVVDESIAPEGEKEEAFDEDGNYNVTNWTSGMVISSGKLNKIEDAIDTINENYDERITVVEDNLDGVIFGSVKRDEFPDIIESYDLATNDYVDGEISRTSSNLKDYMSNYYFQLSKFSDIMFTQWEMADEDYVDTNFSILNDRIDEVFAESIAPGELEDELERLGYASEEYVDNAISNIEIPEVDLSDYATKDEIPSVEGYATEGYVDNAISNIEIPEVDLSDYATKDEIPSVEGLATEEYVNGLLGDIGTILDSINGEEV